MGGGQEQPSDNVSQQGLKIPDHAFTPKDPNHWHYNILLILMKILVMKGIIIPTPI